LSAVIVISTGCQTQKVSGSNFTEKESGSSAKETNGTRAEKNINTQTANFL